MSAVRDAHCAVRYGLGRRLLPEAVLL